MPALPRRKFTGYDRRIMRALLKAIYALDAKTDLLSTDTMAEAMYVLVSRLQNALAIR